MGALRIHPVRALWTTPEAGGPVVTGPPRRAAAEALDGAGPAASTDSGEGAEEGRGARGQPPTSSRISWAVSRARLMPTAAASSAAPAPSTTRSKSSAFFSFRSITFSSMVSADTSR